MRYLFVAHLDKEKVPYWQSVIKHPLPDLFFLETCQRVLLVGQSDKAELPFCHGYELYFGKDAYAFLLEVITGLKSVVVGETEILHQFKRAWAQQQAKLPFLREIFHNLVTDVKEIRTLFLQNLGTVSYGSLVRKAVEKKLSEKQIQPPVDILLVGAGEIAFSIAPYLADLTWQQQGYLFVHNRSLDKLIALTENLRQLGKTNFKMVASDIANILWSRVPVVISAIPYQEQVSEEHFKAFTLAPLANRFIVRLAGEEPPHAIWHTLPKENTLSLQDLFRQREENQEKKERKIAEARKFCATRAKLRFLGGHIAHGWEDLSWFEVAV